jgi:hypothetical protein
VPEKSADKPASKTKRPTSRKKPVQVDEDAVLRPSGL